MAVMSARATAWALEECYVGAEEGNLFSVLRLFRGRWRVGIQTQPSIAENISQSGENRFECSLLKTAPKTTPLSTLNYPIERSGGTGMRWVNQSVTLSADVDPRVRDTV